MRTKRTRCRPPIKPTNQEAIILDLNAIAHGPVSTDTFKQAMENFDFEPYYGKHVQLRGCAPAWAFMMVFSRLYEHAPKIDYLLDNSKGGLPLTVLDRTLF